jgi:Coenzyme PQQ synthesis protein D (PqqD).
MDNIYKVNETFDFIEHNNGAIILFESEEKVFILTNIEKEIFNLIKEKKTLNDIVCELIKKYNAASEVIKNDVSYFIKKLLTADLIAKE